jgi:hypothetical protein
MRVKPPVVVLGLMGLDNATIRRRKNGQFCTRAPDAVSLTEAGINQKRAQREAMPFNGTAV